MVTKWIILEEQKGGVPKDFQNLVQDICWVVVQFGETREIGRGADSNSFISFVNSTDIY